MMTVGNLARCSAVFAVMASVSAFAGERKTIDINGDFEQSESGMPQKWGGVGGVRITEEVYKSESHSFALPFPVSSNGGVNLGQRDIDSSNFKAGDQVEISVSALLKSDLGDGESFGGGFGIWDPSGGRRAGVPFKFEELPGQWQTFTTSMNIPDDFDETWKVRITLVAKRTVPSTVEKAVYFDDVSVTVNSP